MSRSRRSALAIEDLVSRAGKPKRLVSAVEIDQEYLNALNAKIGAKLKDALDTQKHPKFESYALVKEIKDELKKELPAGRCGGGEEAEQVLRAAAREHLPRAGAEGAGFGRTIVRSIRFATSRLRLVCCRGCMGRRCLLVARRRRW